MYSFYLGIYSNDAVRYLNDSWLNANFKLFLQRVLFLRSLLYTQKVNNYDLIDEQKTGLLAIQKSLQIREYTKMEVKTNREVWAIVL